MAFNDSPSAEARLRDPAKLTPEEVRDLKEWMHQISEAGNRRLTAELALQNIEAVQSFDRSSRTLTRWLIGLTGALVLLTMAVVYYTYVLVRAEQNSRQISATLRAVSLQSSIEGATKAYRGFTYRFNGTKWIKGAEALRYNEKTKKMEPESEDQYDPLNLFSKEEKAERTLTEEEIWRVADQFGVTYAEAWEDAKAQGYKVPPQPSREVIK